MNDILLSSLNCSLHAKFLHVPYFLLCRYISNLYLNKLPHKLGEGGGGGGGGGLVDGGMSLKGKINAVSDV